jgi:hypothetical protein
VAARALLYLSLDGDDAHVGLVVNGVVDALYVAVSGGGVVAVLLQHAAAGDEAASRAHLYLSLDGDDAHVGLVADNAVDALCAAVSGSGAATALTSLALPTLRSHALVATLHSQALAVLHSRRGACATRCSTACAA